MKLTGHARTEMLSGAEEAKRGERTEDSAGGARVERRVRPFGVMRMGTQIARSIRLLARVCS